MRHRDTFSSKRHFGLFITNTSVTAGSINERRIPLILFKTSNKELLLRLAGLDHEISAPREVLT
jgi:hypothetical protein